MKFTDAPVATKQIEEYISSIEPKEPGTANRCSAATMCVKRRWYQNQGLQGEEITPRKRINFTLGSLAELTLQHYIREGCVGPGKLYSEVQFGEPVGKMDLNGKEIVFYKQQTAKLHISDELTITGHWDGIGKRNADGKWEMIECKSSANYGFDEFVENGPGDYLKQAHALMATDELRKLDVTEVRFFYLRKETGHVHDRVFPNNPVLTEQVVLEFLAAAKAEAPPAPYGFVEKKIAAGKIVKTVPWQCGYCPYLENCKGKYTLEFFRDKPVYVY